MNAPLQGQGDFATGPHPTTVVDASGGSTTRDVSPVDLPRLLEVSDDDPEQLREMVDLFLDESQNLMQKLGTAIRNGAAPEVEQVAHQFKGASSSCGMTAVVPALQGLERMGKSGQLNGAAQAYAQTGEGLEQIKAFLAGYLQTLR
ncbi:MAG TPA: Hpt domain-containing protein [Chthoniobacterales bacterium]